MQNQLKMKKDQKTIQKPIEITVSFVVVISVLNQRLVQHYYPVLHFVSSIFLTCLN